LHKSRETNDVKETKGAPRRPSCWGRQVTRLKRSRVAGCLGIQVKRCSVTTSAGWLTHSRMGSAPACTAGPMF